MDDLARQAYEGLIGPSHGRTFRVAIHGNLKGYNATVSERGPLLTFRLAPAFARVEPEIAIGVIQVLLAKLRRIKRETDEMRLYHTFLRRMGDFAPVTETDVLLKGSFDRMNERFFDGLMTRPNLRWGRRSTTLLGTYTYGTDTIMISGALRDAPEELLDSVMHHEMLHKKHKFSCSAGRTHSHTPAFKRDEAKYPDVERALQRFLAGARRARVVEERAPSFLQRVMGWR